MSSHGPTSNPAPRSEEQDVRELLTLMGSGPPPTEPERGRIADAMWAALDHPGVGSGCTPQLTIVAPSPTTRTDEQRTTPNRRTTRILFWAAMLLVVAGSTALVVTTTSQMLEPSAPTETGRTTLRLGESEVSFDIAAGYEVETRGPATLTLVADPTNLRSHERITIAQAEELFGGQEPDDFFAGAGLSPEPLASPDGSTAWLVSIATTTECGVDEPCITIATTVGGEPLKLAAGTYARIEIYDNNDNLPVIVLSEVGSPAVGPALANLEVTQ